MNPQKKYSNFNATIAIAKASFRSITRSPSAVVFSLAFPLIFIVVFANIGSSSISVDVAVAKTCDTTGPVYMALKKNPLVHLIRDKTTAQMATSLSRGDIAAIIDIQKNNSRPPYTLNVKYSKASAQKGGVFKSLLTTISYQINSYGNTSPPAVTEVRETTIKGREYKYIDFLLPGMLGFSLLSSGVCIFKLADNAGDQTLFCYTGKKIQYNFRRSIGPFGIFIAGRRVYYPGWALLVRVHAYPWSSYCT
jgi:ABC-2 type transport system permease protein